jgi:hypothetical protein
MVAGFAVMGACGCGLASPAPETLQALRRIEAPRAVAVPPENASRGLMELPDGEIRHYGFRGSVRGKGEPLEAVYLSSRDCGLNWREVVVKGPSAGAMTRSPWSDGYLTVLCHTGRKLGDEFQSAFGNGDKAGFYALRAPAPEGPYAVTAISPHTGFMARQPLPLRQRHRWVQPIQRRAESPNQPGVMLSDDDGATWREVLLPSPPPHKVEWPHLGVRWQNYGCEPTVVELSSGRLWMLIRTSRDCHYEAFSEDAGETWSAPAPSRFYATITMPLLFRMRGGRILAVWNNTTPLPELDHEQQPGLSKSEKEGASEDFFTNRDALHAAVSSDDGATWRGFRELWLNERRNDGDFRSSGGNGGSLDKSIHQSQALELPEGKVLLAFGQHPLCRRMIIFDPDWLLATNRVETFAQGLGGWSVQQYLKSVAGNFRGVSGHCAYNRRAGATLVPHPDGLPREVLLVARHPDPRLVSDVEGAVWNFPAWPRGSLTLRLRQPAGAQGTQICLVDRWFNPTDPVVARFAQHVLTLDAAGKVNGMSGLKPDAWADLEVRWDEAGAQFRVGGGAWNELPRLCPTRNGISYLHIQSAAAGADPAGVLIEAVVAAQSNAER